MNRLRTRSRQILLAIAIAGTALAALPVVQPLAAQASGIAVGTPMPGATVMTLDGKAVELASMIGETPVMIEFFATWCPLCRRLEPQMKALQAKHGSAVKFITVTVPDNQSPERVQQYVEKNQLGGTFLFDRDHAAVKAFQVPHTSYVVVVDKAGMVVYTGVGAEQDLAAALRKAMP